ncbi:MULTISPECIES: DsbA family protein [Deefgea]|uniref:DsbA family protein n=1 Tax=Deefgea chitinilytica TaxID=570276 RepID=A0ABS2CE39_9NEIS|nr:MULTISPECIES: DsbA family protein [Deefgea]MBM5572416.1 DsbA family protein [Deefgea chitinilytica]MBM9889652.1 DsbA family protein [Deefgea sp. CFH1-16]
MVSRSDSAASKPVLHYYFDPLCGWCYAAAPLLRAAAESQALAVQLHAGGMMSGENRQTVTPTLRNYVMPHDQRIAALTGQPFGEAYFNGLLLDQNAVFDSTPPTLAVLAAAALGGDDGIGQTGLAMLARIQHAHYAQGQRIADGTVLLGLAVELGFASAAFAQAMSEQAVDLDAHFNATRMAMKRRNLRGFPSLVLEKQGVQQLIDISPYLGEPKQFIAKLQALLQHVTPLAVAEPNAFCTADGCA